MNSNTTYTPYSDTATETLKKLEAQGLDLTELLKGTSGAQQLFQTGAFDLATGNLDNLDSLTTELNNQVLDQESPIEAANKAETDILSEIGNANDQFVRAMGRYGVNPNSMASNARATALDTATGIVGARGNAEATTKAQNLQNILNAITQSNNTMNSLTNYDATGGLTNAMGTTGSIANIGLTPKEQETLATSRTKKKATEISGGLGFEGLSPAGLFG